MATDSQVAQEKKKFSTVLTIFFKINLRLSQNKKFKRYNIDLLLTFKRLSINSRQALLSYVLNSNMLLLNKGQRSPIFSPPEL